MGASLSLPEGPVMTMIRTVLPAGRSSDRHGRPVRVALQAGGQPRSYRVRVLGALLCVVAGAAVADEKADARVPVALSAGEQAWLLGEMRRNVVVLQQMTAALSEGRSAEVHELAAAFGTLPSAKDPTRPPQLRQKLPAVWLGLTHQLHQDFDGIAEGAAAMETTAQTLARVSRLMQNCVACHSTYRLVEAP